jgi:hypothetical protein
MSIIEAMDVEAQYTEARNAVAKIRDDTFFSWDEREALFLGRTQDQGSDSTKSNVNTQDLTNIIFDGASRVMAQFPTGKIYPVSKNERASASLMNLVFQKYVLPNANSQFDLLTKFRLWDVYSRVYGSMPALVDYVVSDSYIGPDIWLISPRHFFPQAGVHNMHEMQYCFVDNYVSVEWLESKKDMDGWQNVDDVVEKAKAGGTIEDRGEDKTFIEDEYGITNVESGKYAQLRLTTRYEKNKWTTFAPDFGFIVVREIDNPHANGKLPVVMKECYPLMDRIYGLAEFERGKSLQYAANSLVNLYLDGVKFSIFPPTISTKNGVVKDSMSFTPAAHWQEVVPNSIRQLQLSPQGINTFTSTMGYLKSGMLNMAATTDTSVDKATDPGYGRTPEALRQQASREGARDSWDRFMMEQAIEEVFDRFIDMLATKQEAPIPIYIFGKEIDEFIRMYPNEELEVYDGTGMIEVQPDDIAGEFKYIMDTGTTMKKDEKIENEALRDLIMLAVRVPGGLEQISQTGKINFGDKTFDFGEAMKRFVITSGVTDGDKIIRDSTEDEMLLSEQERLKREAGQQPMSQGVPGEGMQPPNMGAPGQPNVGPMQANSMGAGSQTFM